MREDKDTQPLNIQIAVENFGPIEKAEIDLRPLTVFVGESNTGKTYLAALVYALQQTFQGISRIPWTLYTPQRLFSIHHSRDKQQIFSSKQFVPEEEMQNVLKKLNTVGIPFKFSDLPQMMRDRLQYNHGDSETLETELKRCFDLESFSELTRFTNNSEEVLKVALKVHEQNQNLWTFDIHSLGSDISLEKSISQNLVLKLPDCEEFEIPYSIRDITSLLRIPKWEAVESYYLPAARSGFMQSHGIIVSSLVDRATRVGLERFSDISPFSGMIADFLKHIINYKEYEKSSSEITNIAKMLEKEVLRGEIEVARPAGVGYPQFLYRPQQAKQSLRMSQASSMVSELAPLVLFLRGVVKPGDTLIIEEPEAHLHPKAQTQIAITLSRLVRAGVRVIITTHSDWLLEQIGNLVREGEVMKLGKNQTEQPSTWLTTEDVGAWWFHADKPVKEIKFDRITGFEPQDYGKVAEGLYNRSVDLRTQLEDTVGGTEGEQK